MPPSEYTRDRDALLKRRAIDNGHAIGFRAEQIRGERTGTHARVTLTCNDAILAWSNFNIERDEDRLRLANSAFKHLNGLSGAYPATNLKADLDQFCAGLWDAHVANTMPAPMSGSPVSVPPRFLLYPFVLQEGGTIIFAPPGRGKSYTLMLMAVCMDAGLEKLWHPVKETQVLFVNLERGPRSVADRLGNINQALGLSRTRPLHTLNARGKSLADVASSAERYIDKHQIGCVFVDSISRAGAGDLNANENVNRIVDMLNRMCPAWVGLAHTPRSDESHLYGSVHFEAGADVVVRLLSEQDEDGPLGIGLDITKQNDVGRVPMWTAALEFNDSGLALVRRARPGEFTEIEAGKKMTMREAVMAHLRDMGAMSASQVANDLGYNRSVVSDMFNKDRQHFVEAGRNGRNVLYDVLGSVAR